MTQSNLLQLAKQGDAKAIAVLLNQSLKSKSITAKASRKDDCLHILLEAVQIPQQQAMVSFIRNGLIKLEVESIETVKVYGRQTGEESPAWSQKFELVSQPEIPSISEPIDDQISSPENLYQAPMAVSPEVEMPASTNQINFQNPRRSIAQSTTPSSRQLMKPLSVGNVVSTGLRLYRDHFKTYYRVAFIGYLWILVPVYGWAKFSAMTGLLSRLAFNELIERPETVSEARRHVNPRMWSFLGAGILVGLIVFGTVVGVGIVFAILGAVLGMLLGRGFSGALAFVLLGLIAAIAFILGYLWLFSRLFIVEVALAIENNVGATSAIGRSWQLTKGFVLRLTLIVSVAFLISIPISFVIQLVISVVQVVVAALFRDSAIFHLLYYLLVLGLSVASGSLLIPFWQAIKAVIYYDLRNRKEGLGLGIRDSQ